MTEPRVYEIEAGAIHLGLDGDHVYSSSTLTNESHRRLHVAECPNRLAHGQHGFAMLRIIGGGGGIRTPDPLRDSGFQDRRLQPDSATPPRQLPLRLDALEPAHIGPHRLRYRHRPIGFLIVLEHGNQGPPHGQPRSIEGMTKLRPAASLGSEAD